MVRLLEQIRLLEHEEGRLPELEEAAASAAASGLRQHEEGRLLGARRRRRASWRRGRPAWTLKGRAVCHIYLAIASDL